ncbi:hypothetical protein [uncultured Sphingomonas sp.]|uniref:hypothetical protein n=1 Tax=uncultured Sphingomonas sp. TaxID=158754 RepID=UPI0035C9A4B1
MVYIVVFNLIQLLASLYAFLRGGAPERLAGGLLLIAALLTRIFFLGSVSPYFGIEIGILAVDVVLLVALVMLALYADRFWPIWLAALQALGAGAHIAKAIDPTVVSMAYAILLSVWSYPMVLILAAATLRHQRRIAVAGSDLDWSVR